MPDLIGFNLEDAMYLLEKNGLNVEIFGSGYVTGVFDKKGRVINVGQLLIKDSVIKIKLG